MDCASVSYDERMSTYWIELPYRSPSTSCHEIYRIPQLLDDNERLPSITYIPKVEQLRIWFRQLTRWFRNSDIPAGQLAFHCKRSGDNTNFQEQSFMYVNVRRIQSIESLDERLLIAELMRSTLAWLCRKHILYNRLGHLSSFIRHFKCAYGPTSAESINLDLLKSKVFDSEMNRVDSDFSFRAQLFA